MLEKFKPSYFVKSSSKRADFQQTITDEEKQIMQRHIEFMGKLILDGKVLATGPVNDPNGTYGFAIVFAESEDEARELLKDDPALEISTYQYTRTLISYDSK